jgi:hypothetical protein
VRSTIEPFVNDAWRDITGGNEVSKPLCCIGIDLVIERFWLHAATFRHAHFRIVSASIASRMWQR